MSTRKATANDLINLPDSLKIALWDEHAEIIADACKFEWKRED